MSIRIFFAVSFFVNEGSVPFLYTISLSSQKIPRHSNVILALDHFPVLTILSINPEYIFVPVLSSSVYDDISI